MDDILHFQLQIKIHLHLLSIYEKHSHSNLIILYFLIYRKSCHLILFRAVSNKYSSRVRIVYFKNKPKYKSFIPFHPLHLYPILLLHLRYFPYYPLLDLPYFHHHIHPHHSHSHHHLIHNPIVFFLYSSTRLFL